MIAWLSGLFGNATAVVEALGDVQGPPPSVKDLIPPPLPQVHNPDVLTLQGQHSTRRSVVTRPSRKALVVSIGVSTSRPSCRTTASPCKRTMPPTRS